MAKNSENKRILWTDSHLAMRTFGVVAGCFAFGAFYLVLISATTSSIASLCAVFIGIAVVAAYLLLANKKYMRLVVSSAAVVYSLFCIALGFNLFMAGGGTYINNIVATFNANMHWGIASLQEIETSAGADFVFCSVLSAMLGLGSAAICYKSSFYYFAVELISTVLLLCLGLVPAIYAIILLILGLLLLLIFDRGLTLKAASCYLLAAILVFGAVSPVFLYVGSEGMRDFKENVSGGMQSALYGTDSLPQGRLANASGMRLSQDLRLRVTLSGNVRNLYLRGFVGSELEDNRWTPTDKNAYVASGYQGLLEYVSEWDIPFMQYARYSALSGQKSSYEITVENVSANSKYVYVPYTLSGIDVGSKNGDMNLQASVFTPGKYTYSVFAGDRSYESVSQAQWLIGGTRQTVEMLHYIGYEEQYRKFVHDTYGVIDGDTARIIRAATDTSHADEKINPTTDLIRNYFNTHFVYSDDADPIEKDFVPDFFGGKILKANAAYFASAAVLLFRLYGYAARYVEGYLVYADEEQSEVLVSGNFSHAWVEVYFDGMGWLPIEITPGFYKDAPEINPDDPLDQETPEPIKPPDDTEIPPADQPPAETEKPQTPLTPNERVLHSTLAVLVPIASVLLVCVLVVLGFVTHYSVVMHRKRKSVKTQGEAFGRAVYAIVERDCKYIGGFSADNLKTIGIDPAVSLRFTQIIEHCVYGGYELNANERRYVLRYLQDVADAMMRRGGKWDKFVCKYIKCIGI